MNRSQAVVVMGVSGSGKSTVAALLAQRLGWAFAEADAFHTAANVEKMRSGIPLTDEDRGPWLDAIAAWLQRMGAEGRDCLATCSALKRAYRDRLRRARGDVQFVYLEGSRERIAARLAARRHEYMPAALLDSQLRTLEPPGADERAITLSIEQPPEALAAAILAKLRRP